MTKNQKKQAFLIVTQNPSKRVLKLYSKIQNAVADNGEVFLLYHIKKDKPALPAGVNVFTFTNDVLKDLQYKPIRTTLVPGSNHFPVLQFFLAHPTYEYYWCIEDDVAFNGRWSNLFEEVSPSVNYDFITSHIRRHSDIPDWFWWDSYRIPGEDFSTDKLISSFNPIYRISGNALRYIDTSLKNGYRGHHEVLLPSLLMRGGFSIADFGTEENHVTPNLSFCTMRTMRWLPVFLFVGNNKNKLYHPVKTKINFSHVMEYVRRTFKNKKEYLT
jgi:hypothetical protein